MILLAYARLYWKPLAFAGAFLAVCAVITVVSGRG